MASERTDFDFTTVTTRRHMGSTKWSRFDEDVLPLWVADMDFRSPEPVIEALEARVKHGVFGYTFASDALKRTLCDWSARHYGLTLEPAWQHWLPGVVPALHIASQALTELGDDILTLTPIYPPFLHIAENVGRHTQTAALRAPTAEDPQWRLDITALERAITPRTRMLLLCHPHNPTGHVFDSKELAELAALVEKYDLWVCSDELHCDLIHDTGRAHVPLIKAEPRLAERTITLWAPSKTFNVAGLTSACAVIADDGLRKRFKRACLGLMPSDNVMGLVAAQAAFEHGEPWRQALLDVLAGNAELIDRYVAAWPGVSWAKPESTYLGWLDLREAGLGDVPQKALLDKARVGLSDGADFGWPGFVRINFGTSLETLQAALERMDTVLR